MTESATGTTHLDVSRDTAGDRRVRARRAPTALRSGSSTFCGRKHDEEWYDDMEELLHEIRDAGECPSKGVRNLAEVLARYPEINIWYHEEYGWVVDVDGSPRGKSCTLCSVATDRPREVYVDGYLDAVLTVVLIPATHEKHGAYSGFHVDVDFWRKHAEVCDLESGTGQDMLTVKARYTHVKKFDMDTGKPMYTNTCDLQFALEASKETREDFYINFASEFCHDCVIDVMEYYGFDKDEMTEAPWKVTVSKAPEVAAKRRQAQ